MFAGYRSAYVISTTILAVELMASERMFTEPWDEGDVSFVVEGRKIYANKTILSLWSPAYFKAMFSGRFKESAEKPVDLPGKRYNDVLELIRVLHPPNKLVDGKSTVFVEHQTISLLK